MAAGAQNENLLWDTVGPDIFSFKEMTHLIGEYIGHARQLIAVPPALALAASKIISAFVGDVVLTQDEVDGLMAGLLVSNQPPRAKTHLRGWLRTNKDFVGMCYASELERHYQF